MPAIRAIAGKHTFSESPISLVDNDKTVKEQINNVLLKKSKEKTITEDFSICDMEFPLDEKSRAAYRTSEGKAITPLRWAVYDLARTIPCGTVVTYKDICTALGKGSPRSVGTALRNNPFAPYIPCHRVIASSNFVGGFLGEWGQESKTGTHCNMKLDMLRREGVKFDNKGFLLDKKQLWKGMHSG